MPVKLIQNLRLLNRSLPITRFSIMKPNSTIRPTRVFPVLSRVFPHRLKYQSFSKRLVSPNLSSNTELQFGNVRSFSTRRLGSDVKASKSLIEDEAELSDWVSELRSDSFHSSKTKLYSDSDDNGNSGRGRDRVSSGKRRRDGDSDDYGDSRGRRGGFSSRGRGREDSFDSFSRDSRGKGRFGGEFEGKRENDSRGWGRENDSNDYSRSNRGRGGLSSSGRGGLPSRGGGGLASRGGGGLASRGRGGLMDRGGGNRDSDSDDYGRGGLSNRGRGGRDSFESFSRDSRGKGRFGGEMEGRNERFMSQGKENGSRGGRNSPMGSRGGRGSEFGSGRDRGGRGGLRTGSIGSKRGGLLMSDTDDDDDEEDEEEDEVEGVGKIRENKGKGRFGGEMVGRNEGFMSRGKENGSRGGRNSPMGSRGGRGLELGSGRDRGGQGGLRTGSNGSKRGGLLVSDTDDIEDDIEDDDDDDDEDEEDEVEGVGKIRDSFRELISEEDSEEDSEAVDEDEDDGDEVLKRGNSFSRFDITDGPVISPTTGGSDSYLGETRFDQCSVSSSSLKAIKDAGYEKMTIVQEATLPVILKGKDVLAKARTGTGKTVAFLLPSIEVVSKSPPAGLDHKRPPILVLIICPTRELASQAAAEANKLLKYHSSIGVQVVIGGTRLALEQKRMQANPCQILVATPGRLKDHIENTAGFATRLMGVKVLVLDEADHLLDMGFRKDIEKIIAAVPKQRQTLLFSATVPQEVRQICHIALKRDHEYINTVEEGSEETHAQVRQAHLVAPLDAHFPLLYVLLKEHIADDVDYKVLVFCTTAMVTRLVADLLGELNLNVREIHSRKPQSYRTRVSDEFRKSKGLILVTSDVSARGVDYPDVSLVIQVGLPSGKEQYIHRLGRTGRKGKEGQGILLLAPWEEFFLSAIRDLPISKASSPSVDPDTKKKVEKALSHVEMKNKEAAYQAWLGYYNSNKTVGKDKYRLVELANDFSRCMGLDNPPAIPKLVLGKMGLKNVPGLRSK